MAAGGALIGALRVSLALDSAQFEAGTKRARTTAQRDANAIQKSLAGIKGSLNGLIAGATIGALTAAAKRALDFAGGLGEVSQQLGVTTRDLQVYRYVASQVGVEQDTMDSSLAKLTRTMGQAANGSKSQAEAFRDLGVAVQDQNGKLYTAGQILPRLADAFARIKDPATRARLEAELFGRAGQKLDPLLTQGAKGIETLTKRAEELGLVLGDDLINSADAASDKLAEMQKQLEVGFARAIANSADAIVGLANAFASLTSQVLNFINKYPQLVAALGGAAVGARFGPVGAAVGGLGGLVAGDKLAQARDNANMDPAFRAKQLKNSIAKWRGAKASAAPGATMSTMGMSGGISSGAGSDKSAWAEVERQWGLFNQAKANAGKPLLPALPPPGDLPTASGGRTKKGPKDRTRDYLERYQRELSDLMEEELDQRAELTTDARERAMFEHQRLDTTREAYLLDVANREKAGELTGMQAETLRLQSAENLEREKMLLNRRLEEELDREDLDLQRSMVENRAALLQGELQGARTQADRRRLQLAILKGEKALERFTLEQVETKKNATEVEKEIARARLAQLDKEYGQRAGAIRRDTMGPMESYLDSLPRTADELNEAFERVSADGLQSLTDGIAGAIAGTQKLGDVFKNVANQIIADLIRIELQKAITKGLSTVLGSFSSAGTGGAGAAGSAAASAIPGFAGGGSFLAGGVPGIDRNVLAINGIPRARVSANENIKVGYGGGDQGGSIAQIVPSPYFDVIVDGRAAGVSTKVTQSSNSAAMRRGRQRLA